MKGGTILRYYHILLVLCIPFTFTHKSAERTHAFSSLGKSDSLFPKVQTPVQMTQGPLKKKPRRMRPSVSAEPARVRAPSPTDRRPHVLGDSSLLGTRHREN